MKKRTALTVYAIGVALIVFGFCVDRYRRVHLELDRELIRLTKPKAVRWFNAEQRERNATNRPFEYYQTFLVASGPVTNLHWLEFGFREDGVVVWRDEQR